MKAVIIAAGCGSRLKDQHHGIPKTLLEVHGKRIIDDILQKIHSYGISDVIIITGFKGALLKEHLSDYQKKSLKICFVENRRWKESNGISVLCAQKVLSPSDTFLLMMSDHIFDKGILEKVISTPIDADEALLAIDRKIDSLPDLDDGMKLQCDKLENDLYSINKFGKNLAQFSAIDTGIFKFQYSFFYYLKKAIALGNDSLSDACNLLCKDNMMKGIDIGNNLWLDIDTPEMLEQGAIIDHIFNTYTKEEL